MCVCVCVRFPHKTFIYSNDLEEVPRVPGRLALETGDRLSFLPDLLCRSPVFISHRGSHGGGFRPLTPFPVQPRERNRIARSNLGYAPGYRATIYRVSIIAIPIDIHSAPLSFFSFFPFPSRRGGRWNWERSRGNRKRGTCGLHGDHVGEENSLRFQPHSAIVRGEKSIASSRTLIIVKYIWLLY